jgi:hypothetical protein
VTILPVLPSGILHEELLAMQLGRDAEMPVHEGDDRISGHVHFLIAAEQHLHARRDQEGREQIERPVELLHQRRTRRDHQAAQHDHRDDAP